jgi:hypothetical protein
MTPVPVAPFSLACQLFPEVTCVIDGTDIPCTEIDERIGQNDCMVDIVFSIAVCNSSLRTAAKISRSDYTIDLVDIFKAPLSPDPIPFGSCATADPVTTSIDACNPKSIVRFRYLVVSPGVCGIGDLSTTVVGIIPFPDP